MRRAPAIIALAALISTMGAVPALACGGLIGPEGAVNLLRTSTLAAYRNGVEHYITSFEFAGGGARFGSITPLPGIPSDVIKGGDWTLQRLAIETQPQPRVLSDDAEAAGGVAVSSAKVLLEKRIDSLDITILEGGGDAVGRWAEDNGFNLPPDAPEVLDFYARRSPIFMAARFDASAAREQGFGKGDGIPVHLVIPTPDPWVPLRILALGKQPAERIEADVYLLTEQRPNLLPAPVVPGLAASGLVLERSEPASSSLLADLRSDRGMEWLPAEDMWLTYLRVDSEAGDLDHDLAIDATGLRRPSPVAAGLVLPGFRLDPDGSGAPWAWVVAGVGAAAFVYAVNRKLSPAP